MMYLGHILKRQSMRAVLAKRKYFSFWSKKKNSKRALRAGTAHNKCIKYS